MGHSSDPTSISNMNNQLLLRVKSSLRNQHYITNDSWLSDCVDFYLNDHENPALDEVTAFVTNQWTLYDIRETNDENGCLPRNLANQKCTTLPGKYILQVDKMYDISTSKYKQLEKIRNVSSENIDATENENKTHEDKFQAWEPKSKRMLQFFLTDGVQDILAIEFKTIRFLKDLLPGYKLLIKGPVTCRKGVILLEEKHITEIGGEVDSLLHKNAVENVLARALNLEENPDPYNDKTRPKQNTQDTQKTIQVEDDFDIDPEVIDQIDQQIQHQNTNSSKNSAKASTSNKQSLSSKITEFNYSYQAQTISNLTSMSKASSSRNQLSGATSSSYQNNAQNNNQGKITVDFDDEGDTFLEMVDDSEFKTLTLSKMSTLKSKHVTTKETVSSKNKDGFPVDDEIYDLTEPHSPVLSSPKPRSQSTTIKTTSQKKDSCSIASNSKNVDNSKQSDVGRETKSSKTNFQGNPSISSNYQSTSKVLSKNKVTYIATPSVSEIDFDDNFDFNDIDMDLDNFDDYSDKNKKTNNPSTAKQVGASTSSSPKVNSRNVLSEPNTESIASSDATNYENEFELDLYEECKKKFQTPQPSIQPSAKSFSTLKNEEPITMRASSQVTNSSLAKLSDKLKFENKSKDYYNMNTKVEEKDCKSNYTTAEHLSFQTNESSSFNIKSENNIKSEKKNSFEKLNADFEDSFDIEFEARMEVDIPKVEQMKIKSQGPVDNVNDIKSTSSKRLASPSTNSRQKLRCVETTPKDKANSRKITDFFNKPEPKILNFLSMYEAICDVIEILKEKDRIRSVVRGKVTNVVKLSLLKGEKGSYFHLDGKITDGTASLDVVFSSEVLEGIVGYTTDDFILKRKRAKADPNLKNELRDDLTKAQQILRHMDALMEIEMKKNEKALIVGVKLMTEEDKKKTDQRLAKYKSEKKS